MPEKREELINEEVLYIYAQTPNEMYTYTGVKDSSNITSSEENRQLKDL